MIRGFDLAVVEGELEVVVAKRLCHDLEIPCPPPVSQGGGSHFWQKVEKYNQATKSGHFIFGLVDVEQAPCAPSLLAKHLPKGKSPSFCLRMAQPMVEAWLLADREGIAAYLHVSKDLVPPLPENEAHPKQTVVNLARKSRKSSIRDTLVPEKGLSSKVGKEYFPVMKSFVEAHWDFQSARQNSPSLHRALLALEAFRSSMSTLK